MHGIPSVAPQPVETHILPGSGVTSGRHIGLTKAFSEIGLDNFISAISYRFPSLP